MLRIGSVLALIAALVAVALITTGSTGGSTSVASPTASVASAGPGSPSIPTGAHATPIVHVPASLPAGTKVPLVIALHGAGSSPAGAQTTTGFDRLADRYGFISAYLGSGSPGATWKSAGDTTYVSQEITALEARYPIDPQRVFITGFSAGGYEAYRAGCLLSRQVAGVAPVGVSMNKQLYDTCRPARPVSALIIIGTADSAHKGGTSRLPSVAATAALWRTIDGCRATLQPKLSTAGGPTTQQLWSGCADASAVGLYQIQGGYHIWPSPGLRNNTPDSRYDAATAVWQFFSGLRAGSLTRPDVQRVRTSAAGLTASGKSSRRARQVNATLVLGEPLTATITLSARGHTVVRRQQRLGPGTNVLHVRLPGSAHAARYGLRIVLVDRYGRTQTITRTLGTG